MPFNSDQTKSILLDLLKFTKKEKIAIGYELLSIDDAAPFSLSIPHDANYAEIRIEETTGATGIVARYLLLGDVISPTAGEGMGLSHLDLFDISSRENLQNFRIIANTSLFVKVYIQYYK